MQSMAPRKSAYVPGRHCLQEESKPAHRRRERCDTEGGTVKKLRCFIARQAR
jgi:hypothetical protein